MSRPELRGAGARVRLVGGVLGLCFVLLGARAAFLTVVDRRGAERGRAQTGTVLRVAPARGEVVDRQGAPLAVTMPAPSIYAVPAEIDDPAATARALARALGRRSARLEERLAQGSPFVFLARWVTPDRAAAVAALDLRGVGIVEEPRRTYPLGRLAGRFLGFANIDGEGVRGIEQGQDEWLRGHEQRIALERDARGRLLAPGGVDPRATAGGDVAVSIDSALQASAERALADVVTATGAAGGTVIALDPGTGDVLALAEAPAFDPNDFRRVPYRETGSAAFLSAIEPGSTLKPVVVAAGLEAGLLRPDDVIDCGDTGSYRVPGKTLRDRRPYGPLDLAGILRVSSNIGVARIAERIPAATHHATLRALGFGARTGSGFPNESAGLLRPAARWKPLDQATIAFGQGINVTPIQLAAATAVFANGGIWRAPRLVTARRRPGGEWVPMDVAPGRTALRRDVADRVREMLVGVTRKDGTGRLAALRGVEVAGKTGTAQKFDPETGTYSHEDHRGWFIGMAPAEDPRIVVVVMIDEPKGRAHGGGSTAAPLFARVAAAALGDRGIVTAPLHGLPAIARVDGPAAASPARPPGVSAPPPLRAAAPATRPARPEPTPAPVDPIPPVRVADAAPRRTRATPAVTWFGDRVLLPDLRGLTPEQVKEITDTVPFALEAHGKGHVVEQEPAPGTVVGGGARVRLRYGRNEG